jgi:hypothetical protein
MGVEFGSVVIPSLFVIPRLAAQDDTGLGATYGNDALLGRRVDAAFRPSGPRRKLRHARAAEPGAGLHEVRSDATTG